MLVLVDVVAVFVSEDVSVKVVVVEGTVDCELGETSAPVDDCTVVE